jgi:hypothetical protein
MFWRFRRPTRRPWSRSRACFRPNIEQLEDRRLLSVSVVPSVNPTTGAATLLVRTDGADDTVTITDNSTAGKTTVVADGQSTSFDHQFAAFNLQLASTKDTLNFDLVGAYSARHADVRVSLGKGENHVTFNPDQTALTNHSSLNLNVLGHNGNDFVNLNFGEVLESSLNVQAVGLGGSKTPLSPASLRDSITFGAGKTGVRNSSVDVNVRLGRGNNNLQFNYGIDLGHLAPPDGTAAAASDFGPSTMNVNITGGGRSRDADNVTLMATGEVNTASTLNFNTQFLAGNNTFNGVFDANTFQIDDDGGAFINGPNGTTPPHSGGAAHFNILGGHGNDSVTFASINQDHTTELSGLFDTNIIGGAGSIRTKVDFGGTGFTDDDPFEIAATNREFRLRAFGGDGNDTTKVNLANAATATFAYDVAIQGGGGNNDITFVGTNPSGGTPKFGPAGAVVINGGFGGQNQVDTFGNFPVQVANAGG